MRNRKTKKSEKWWIHTEITLTIQFNNGSEVWLTRGTCAVSHFSLFSLSQFYPRWSLQDDGRELGCAKLRWRHHLTITINISFSGAKLRNLSYNTMHYLRLKRENSRILLGYFYTFVISSAILCNFLPRNFPHISAWYSISI